MDASFAIAEAVAVRGDRIVAVGADGEIEPYVGPETRIVELRGRLVVPGLIDAHAHLLSYGLSLDRLDFRGTNSFGQIVDQVRERARTCAPGEWILGRNWDQNDWDVKELPTHEILTKVTPGNPVWLTRVDGHAALANKKAMELAGITAKTRPPGGGEILRDATGEATGVFVDNAMGLVSRHIPAASPQHVRKALRTAAQRCLEVGLTGIHDAGVSPGTVEHLKRLIDQDQLGIRVNAMLHDPGHAELASFMRKNRNPNYGNHFLRVCSMKLLVDGALGSRGAAMLEPYSDRPGHTGLVTTSYDRVLQVSRIALREGFQVCTHAIGDRGNRLVLDAYEQALKEQPVSDHRFRIEHAQIVALADIPRFVQLGVIPSMQPTHATSDMYWAEDRVGPDRIEGAYAWRKFRETGAVIACGSDFPVEENNPMLGIYAAVTRQDPTGWPEGGWYPQERMTREEALRGFTIWAAYAARQEDILGSIEVGKLADMVVLSKDVLSIPANEILTAVADDTIVGGRVRYRRTQSSGLPR